MYRKNVLLALACVLASSSITLAQVTLSRIDLETVVSPRPLVSVDLDNDGDLDLVTVSQSAPKDWMAIHLNNGDGTFANALYTLVNNDASGGITDVATGDLNHDGAIDIVVSSYGNYLLTVYYGNGDGTFFDTTVFPNSPIGDLGVSAIALADFTGDGWLDIGTITRQYNASIGIYQNTDSGRTFLPPVQYYCGLFAQEFTVADLNNDGGLDAVVINWQEAKFAVLLGNGEGGFGQPTQYNLPNWSFGVVVANLVGDTNLDVAVTVTDYQGETGSTITQVRVYRGVGDGTLVLFDSIATAANPVGITAADMNGDGGLDLLWVCADADLLQIACNAGDIGFAQPTSYPTADEPFYIVAADFEGKGHRDVIVTARRDRVLCVYHNESTTICIDSDFDGFGDPGHPENVCPTDNCPFVYNPNQADWDSNGVGDACTPTDTGTNVIVQPTVNTLITFDSVSTSGTTGATITSGGPIPPVNVGVVPLGTPQYLNIFSSAAFSGLVTLTVAYNPNDLVGPEDSLQLLHYENGLWIDITVSRDTAANTITGVTTSLSPFALVERCCSGMLGNVDCSHDGRIDISDLTRIIDYLYISFTPLCCSAGANVDGSPDNHIDISDLTALVDYLYISFTPPTTCN